MSKRNSFLVKRSLLSSSMLLAGGMHLGLAYAADEPPADEKEAATPATLDVVQVTGSRVLRAGPENLNSPIGGLSAQ